MRSTKGFLALAVALALLVTPTLADDNPWANLKVGDWASYEGEPAPGMKTETKQVVTAVEGTVVSYETHSSMTMNGAPLGEPTVTPMTLDYAATAGGEGAEPAEAPKFTEEEVEVNGQTLACKVYTTETDVAGTIYVSKSWVCLDVPFGTVKAESNGTVSMMLVAWGHAE